MIQPNEIKFTSVKTDAGDLIIKGTLTLDFGASVSRHEITPEAIERAKHLIRMRCWQRAYGDIVQPLAELEQAALHFAANGHELYVERLSKQLRDLLSLPKPAE